MRRAVRGCRCFAGGHKSTCRSLTNLLPLAVMRRHPYTETGGLDEIEAVTEQLLSQTRFVADSCSVILCAKAGFLSPLQAEINLLTVPGVLAETGYAAQGFTVLGGYEAADTDTAVVQAVRDTSAALLSDDRAVMERVHRFGGLHYNAVMALLALLGRGAVNVGRFEQCRAQLYLHCRYTPAIRRFADAVYWCVRKQAGI